MKSLTMKDSDCEFMKDLTQICRRQAIERNRDAFIFAVFACYMVNGDQIKKVFYRTFLFWMIFGRRFSSLIGTLFNVKYTHQEGMK